MKFWLIFMLFNSDGEYITKFEIPTNDRTECFIQAGSYAIDYTNSGYLTQSWCVTDDHYMGRGVDDGIPLD
jgi:hypothetical protein